MDRSEALALARRLRRETRHADVIALCDYVLKPPADNEPGAAGYREYMRDYMRKYRKKKKGDG